jgi:hypothetical protein
MTEEQETGDRKQESVFSGAVALRRTGNPGVSRRKNRADRKPVRTGEEECIPSFFFEDHFSTIL